MNNDQEQALLTQLIQAASGSIDISEQPYVLLSTSGPGEPTTLIITALIVPNEAAPTVQKIIGGAIEQCQPVLKHMHQPPTVLND